MKDTQIGIIGGTRRMGRWFADYLTGQGHVVREMRDVRKFISFLLPVTTDNRVLEVTPKGFALLKHSKG